MYSTHKIADYKIYGLEICIPPFNSYAIRSIPVPYALQTVFRIRIHFLRIRIRNTGYKVQKIT
jgi:hypothetical protein